MKNLGSKAMIIAGVCGAFSNIAKSQDVEGVKGSRPEGNSLSLLARHQVPSVVDPEAINVIWESLNWNASETAFIICDMWNQHWCQSATRRVAEMAPALNAFASRARDLGVLIIHAPSECMQAYEGHPARKRAQVAAQGGSGQPKAIDLPLGSAAGCASLPGEDQAKYPIDQSDGGCDDEPQCAQGTPWRSQIASIEIRDEDAISDSGPEIWRLMDLEGIKNVMLAGVHTNMCVLERPFGLRNMVRTGKNVVLVRDLTDSMYNPRMKPFVTHCTGTDLIVEHIERFVCPTILSTSVTGQPAFRFEADRRPRVVFISAENEYGAAESLPAFGTELELTQGMCCEVLQGSTANDGPGRHDVPGMDALDRADVAVLFARRRALPTDQMKHLKDFLHRGGSLIALRTSCHALAPREEISPDLEAWPAFDQEVLGCHYDNYPHGAILVSLIPEAKNHPIVKGLEGPYQVRETLYTINPLAPTCVPLLMGRCVDGTGDNPRFRKKEGEETPDQAVAWTNTYGQSKVFYTSLGDAQVSFKEPWYRQMLTNAILWALEK